MPSTDLDHSTSKQPSRDHADAESGAATAPSSTDEHAAHGPAAQTRAARVRRRIGRLKRGLARTVTVRLTSWNTVEVALLHGARSQRYRLDDPRAARTVRARVLRIEVPDAACLERLAASCLLTGQVREVRLRIETMPTWLRGGLGLAGMSRDVELLTWRASGAGVEVRLAWRTRRTVGRALSELGGCVLRSRWEQLGGVVPVLDRSSWLDGSSTWPFGKTEEDGGAFTRLRDAAPAPALPVVTALANPHGRRLLGAATAYTLRPGRDDSDGADDAVVLATADGVSHLTFRERDSVERQLLDRTWHKYAVAEIGEDLPDTPFVAYAVAGLAACGVVLASSSAAVRARLAARGYVVVADPSVVTGLAGYQLSVAASRTAAILADPVLRQTALRPTLGDAPEATTPSAAIALPTISVLVASKRADDIATCLSDLAAQSYPAFEVLVGTHGYALDAGTLAALRTRLRAPLRTVEVPPERTLGEALGSLARLADGEFVTKVDDDDRYGPEHLTDLLVAWRTSGADLAAKSARFVHLTDSGQTVDRTWAAVEAYDVIPAGGTLLLSRGTLQAVGGWSTSRRHVDADLLARIRTAGGTTYRTHGLGYAYVRRSSGHTWQAEPGDLLHDGEVLYDGLPEAILTHEPC